MDISQIIADLTAGAEHAGGSVQLSAAGREEKLANNVAGAAAVLGGHFGHRAGIPRLVAVPVGAALGAEDGRGWQAAGGGLLGGIGGSLVGAGLGSLAGRLTGSPEMAQRIMESAGTIGGAAGSYVGAQHFGAAPKTNEQMPQEERYASVTQPLMLFHYYEGAQRAKQAFLGAAIGGIASALAPTAARGVLGKVAPRMAGALAKPVAGALFDTGVGMAANKALGT